MTELYKHYINVVVKYSKQGIFEPLSIIWDDGRQYTIDKVLDIHRRAASVGGCGIRYECLIHGKRRNLFFEKDRWFIESHLP